jgi:superfamily II RNA helicase
MRGINKTERQFRISPLSKKFFFSLSPVAKLWFQGADFSKLSRFSGLDEGEIVRYFRMSIQVLRQLHTSSQISPTLRTKVANCLRRVNRGVIDAERQLRQEI